MNSNDKVRIALTISEWNQVLAMLAKQPYEVSAWFIQQIGGQIQATQQAAQSPSGHQGYNGIAAYETGKLEPGREVGGN